MTNDRRRRRRRRKEFICVYFHLQHMFQHTGLASWGGECAASEACIKQRDQTFWVTFIFLELRFWRWQVTQTKSANPIRGLSVTCGSHRTQKPPTSRRRSVIIRCLAELHPDKLLRLFKTQIWESRRWRRGRPSTCRWRIKNERQKRIVSIKSLINAASSRF